MLKLTLTTVNNKCIIQVYHDSFNLTLKGELKGLKTTDATEKTGAKKLTKKQIASHYYISLL